VLRDAPDVPKHCVAVLIGLANHAHEDGRYAWAAQPRLAFYARKDERSVQNDLNTLEQLGLIRRGNQSAVLHLPPDRRPVVWDLALERQRVVPAQFLPRVDPKSGKGYEDVQVNRGEADFPPVVTGGKPTTDRGEAHFTTGVKPTSPKPSLNHKRTKKDSPRCEKHYGQPANACKPCALDIEIERRNQMREQNRASRPASAA
jgi:hypothetical protein